MKKRKELSAWPTGSSNRPRRKFLFRPVCVVRNVLVCARTYIHSTHAVEGWYYGAGAVLRLNLFKPDWLIKIKITIISRKRIRVTCPKPYLKSYPFISEQELLTSNNLNWFYTETKMLNQAVPLNFILFTIHSGDMYPTSSTVVIVAYACVCVVCVAPFP